MKLAIKYQLSKTAIWSNLDQVRYLRQTMRWMGNGCAGMAPPPVKRMVLAAYLRRFSLNQFIETGTYMGDTLAHMALDKSVNCTSIELDDNYYQSALQRFSSYTNVRLFKGDSGKVLLDIVHKLEAPSLFWLDGHYSGAMTARGDVDTPISTELQVILDSPIKNHVILIDDARQFDGTSSYPYLDVLLDTIRKKSAYHIEISIDIIRLTPQLKTE